MSEELELGIVGATGAVGREIIHELESFASELPAVKLRLFASARSSGQSMGYCGRSVQVETFSRDATASCSYLLMSAGGDFSREHAEALVQQGSFVIDNSSAWRMRESVALVVPEINGDLLAGDVKPQIISNPNCSTIQLVVPLAQVQKAFGLKRVEVATYQSVSGSGQKGLSELGEQTAAFLRFQENRPSVYGQQIAFNVLPVIDRIDEAGHSFEEEKMVRETRKILNEPELDVFATAVRVPTMIGHGEAVTVELQKEVSLDELKLVFTEADRQGVLDFQADASESTVVTPRKVAGSPRVAVSRVRLPLGKRKASVFQMWVIADNLKKGAATNAVQILMSLLSAEK